MSNLIYFPFKATDIFIILGTCYLFINCFNPCVVIHVKGDKPLQEKVQGNTSF